jgi:hypothetical protein
MALPYSGWSNVTGTSNKSCNCGTWQKHWIKFAKKTWPSSCSVVGCTGKPTLGAHIKNSEVTGVRIAPFCNSCNGLSGKLTLKHDVSLPSATATSECG